MSRFGVKMVQNGLIDPFYEPVWSQIRLKRSHRSVL